MENGFSGDGYIIDQSRLGNYQYGRYTSDFNGCGWMAVYNMLHSMGFSVSPDDARKLCMTALPVGGLIGTPTKNVVRALDKLGVRTVLIKGKKNINASASKYDRGILRYFDGEYDHYAAFVRTGGNLYRFFNSEPDREYDILTMDTFLRTRCRLPNVKMIAALPPER